MSVFPTVVYHHGQSAQGGHYTCDVYHSASSKWLRIDDSLITTVAEESVLRSGVQQGHNRVAYLLFYRRQDTILTSAKSRD